VKETARIIQEYVQGDLGGVKKSKGVKGLLVSQRCFINEKDVRTPDWGQLIVQNIKKMPWGWGTATA